MTKPQTVHLIACGALAREIQAIASASGLDHFTFSCLPARLHNQPARIPQAVRQAVIKARSQGHERIFIGYGDCGTGGLLDKVCEEEGVSRIAGPHCYAFYSGTQSFLAAGDRDMATFFLTDFLARNFRSFVVEPLGLDRYPALRDDYFRHYKQVVYLEQIPDPAVEQAAREGAEFLQLPFKKRATGFGDLGHFLEDMTTGIH